MVVIKKVKTARESHGRCEPCRAYPSRAPRLLGQDGHDRPATGAGRWRSFDLFEMAVRSINALPAVDPEINIQHKVLEVNYAPTLGHAREHELRGTYFRSSYVAWFGACDAQRSST